MSIIQDYLVIPAEHLIEIIKVWEEKHFGHIIHDKSKVLTAEYARTNAALADIKATLSEHIVPQSNEVIVPDETPDSTVFKEVDPTEILQHAAEVQTIDVPALAIVEPEVKTETEVPVNVESTEAPVLPVTPEAIPQ